MPPRMTKPSVQARTVAPSALPYVVRNIGIMISAETKKPAMDPTNEPAAGTEYVAAYVRLRNIADADSSALAFDSLFTGASGEAEFEQPSVVEPEPQLFAQLFPGGVAEGWVVVAVPAGDETARLAFRGTSISTESRGGWRYFALP